MSGTALSAAALALVGTPFRLHGRDPATGLDCVGLLAAALVAAGRPARLPSGYPLKLRDLRHWLPDPATLGFVIAAGRTEPGDVLLLNPGPAQYHIAIAAAAERFVHAHAGLRRVVLCPACPEGRVIGRWRLPLNPQDT